MNKKQLAVIVLLAALSGFIGGIISDRLARAEKDETHYIPKIIVAKGFAVVDRAGKRIAYLGHDDLADGPSLQLVHPDGKTEVGINATERVANFRMQSGKPAVTSGGVWLQVRPHGDDSSFTLFGPKGDVILRDP